MRAWRGGEEEGADVIVGRAPISGCRCSRLSVVVVSAVIAVISRGRAAGLASSFKVPFASFVERGRGDGGSPVFFVSAEAIKTRDGDDALVMIAVAVVVLLGLSMGKISLML